MKNVRITESAIRKVGHKEAFKCVPEAQKVAKTKGRVLIGRLKNGLALVIEKGTLVLF